MKGDPGSVVWESDQNYLGVELHRLEGHDPDEGSLPACNLLHRVNVDLLLEDEHQPLIVEHLEVGGGVSVLDERLCVHGRLDEAEGCPPLPQGLLLFLHV